MFLSVSALSRSSTYLDLFDHPLEDQIESLPNPGFEAVAVVSAAYSLMKKKHFLSMFCL